MVEKLETKLDEDLRMNESEGGASLVVLLPVVGDKIIHDFFSRTRSKFSEDYGTLVSSYLLEAGFYGIKYGAYLKLGLILTGKID